MINTKIKKACDKILPTEAEKGQMLEHILSAKKTRGFQKYWLIGIFSTTITAVFCLSLSHPASNQPGISMTRMMNLDQIEYNGKCYEYMGIHNGKNLKRTSDQIMGGIVYQIQGQKDSIVIYENGEYQHYQECRGE